MSQSKNLGQISSVDTRDQTLFTGDLKGVLRQFSVGGQNLVHNFGKINDRPIQSILCIEKFLFVGDKYGYVKQFCVDKRQIVKDYGKCNRDFVTSIVFWGLGGRRKGFIFIGDVGGRLRQFLVKVKGKRGGLWRDWGRVFQGRPVSGLQGAKSFVFVVGEGGWMKMVDVKRGLVVRDFGKEVLGNICCITSNSDQ